MCTWHVMVRDRLQAALGELERIQRGSSWPSALCFSFAPRTLVGATKLIQYAHWERDRFKTSDKPPPILKLNLSDNCVDRPSELVRGSCVSWCVARV